ncbi:MAG: caspase family protein [Deltaproteobacteria bacterium]|nr:caspase family protein [Deltaproteobacteria bacterium]
MKYKSMKDTILKFFWITFVIPVFLSGCVSPHAQQIVKPEPGKSGFILSNEVNVISNIGWQKTGIKLAKDQPFAVTASGLWNIWFAGMVADSGPEGYSLGGLETAYDNRFAIMSLIGRIGTTSPFYIGSYLSTTAETGGELELRPNSHDKALWDNSGSLTARIFLKKENIVSEQTKQSLPSLPPMEPIIKPISDEKLPPLRSDTFAIIIGIDYRNRQDIPNLQYSSQDAKKVYDILTDARYGGIPKENTILLLNEKATRNEMIAALRKIKTWDGYVYVYYSGHGAPKTKEDKFVDGFLVPNDVVITDPEAMEDTSIKISYLQDLVDSSQAKGVMVALDACFSGGGKSIVPKGGKPLVGMLVTPELIKPKGTGKVIITSSATNQQSWEDETELKSGIFSHYLLEGLKGKAGKDVWVKVDELADYIKENVSKAARKLKGIEQNPQISGKGDFAVTRNWEKAKIMDIEIARAKLKSAFEREFITAEQLNRALDELKLSSRSRILEAFLEGKIDENKFGELY